MQTALAWVWAPAASYLLVFGLGLFVERVVGVRLANALLAPVGLCAAIVVVMPIYRAGANIAVALPVVAMLALGGLIRRPRDLWSRLGAGPLGLAGLATFGLYLAPIALTGHWTW